MFVSMRARDRAMMDTERPRHSFKAPHLPVESEPGPFCHLPLYKKKSGERFLTVENVAQRREIAARSSTRSRPYLRLKSSSGVSSTLAQVKSSPWTLRVCSLSAMIFPLEFVFAFDPKPKGCFRQHVMEPINASTVPNDRPTRQAANSEVRPATSCRKPHYLGAAQRTFLVRYALETSLNSGIVARK
jgi:hypothetical protein